jgi:sphinganine-1-phosphate aldolase
MYAHANPLHADAFPAVARMEAEIVAMTARMLGGGERAGASEPSSSEKRKPVSSSSSSDVCVRSGVCGLTTSGGTESILTAIRATRDYMRETRGITKPEMIAATSAHAAVYKAAEYFGIRLLIAPVDEHYRMDVAATRRLITRNTILLYASAPGYPHGAMDPVEALGALAVRKKICLHVDACLGGFVMPFAGEAGEETLVAGGEASGQRRSSRRPAEAFSGASNGVAHPREESEASPAPPIAPFDFRVPGVTSMSVDTHKYGLAQKGSSVVLYSSSALRQRQYTAVTNWSGGLYISPTQAGSRSGGLIAQTWAALVHMGREGYRRNAAAVLKAAVKLRRGIAAIEGLTLVGSDATMVVAWGSADPTLNVYVVNDVMTKKGWHLSVLHAPAALHMCLTPANVGAVDALLEDLRDAVGEARRAGGRGVDGGKAPIYGLAGGLPDRGVVGDILKDVQDLMLENI